MKTFDGQDKNYRYNDLTSMKLKVPMNIHGSAIYSSWIML